MSLQLDGVTVSVPDGANRRVLLDDVSVTITPGEIVAMTGASGSGKSTLIAVGGLLRAPEGGTVRVAGEDVSTLSERKRARVRGDRIGIVYQAANLLPALTALEQVEIAAHVVGRLDAAARKRAVELLERVGLQDRFDSRPAELSGGERQRVAIARALMNEPKLVLADEPTASLDPERAADVIEVLFQECRRIGAATLVVTHDDEQASRADRRLYLARGQVGSEPV